MSLHSQIRNRYAFPDTPAIELRAFTHGLMPKTVPKMMQQFAEDWQKYGVDAWNHIPNHWKPDANEKVGWWNLPDYLGDAFIAPLLHAPLGTCIMMPNAHTAITGLMSCNHLFETRKKVVVSADAFPSALFPIYQWAELYGLHIEVVPLAPDGFTDQKAILTAISTDTALVVLTHVGFTTSEVLSHDFVREVAQKTHHNGGLLVVDGYHATGAVPTYVEEMEADFYVGGLLKEASGSSGNGYLYIRPELDLKPRTAGWFADAEPFSFNHTPMWHPQVRRRFLGGTTAVAPLYHAVEGLKILLEMGIPAVRQYSLALTEHALMRAKELHLRLRSPIQDTNRGPMVILEMEHADKMCHFLKQHGLFTDSRKGQLLRFAPFVWNHDTELDRLFDVLGSALKSKTYLQTELASEGPVT